VIALVDTNCDPDEVSYVVPGNDDAIRSCSLVIRAIADGMEAGKRKVTEAEIAAAPAREESAAAAEPDTTQPAEEAPEEAAASDEPVAVENGATT
jgi:small subunit ribosomal protein S2